MEEDSGDEIEQESEEEEVNCQRIIWALTPLEEYFSFRVLDRKQ